MRSSRNREEPGGRFLIGSRSGYAPRVSDGDNVHDLVPELLRAIRDELRGVNARLERLEVGQVRLESSIAGTNTRFDRLLENTGAHWRELDARVRKLERKKG